MFDAELNATDFTLAVPILVLVIEPVEVTLIFAFETQCKSTVLRLSIGQFP